MPLCLQQNPDNTLSVVLPQPVEPSTCSVVALSGAEFVSVQASPWNLTVEQAGQIGGAITLVWAIAWAWRLFAAMVHPSSQPQEKEMS